jgi:hypothetical protein
MPRLIINPGTPQAWEIHLKPGLNFLGRGISNDFKLEDPSISGSHCQIVVDKGSVMIKDMGSTNGTYVNRAKVMESRLESGQPLRLGSLDMIFYTDGPDAVKTLEVPPPPAQAIAPPPPAPLKPGGGLKLSGLSPAPAPMATATAIDAPPPPPPPLKPTPGLRISGLAHASETSSATATLDAPPMLDPAVAGVDIGAKFCKFHPKSPARYLCKKCNRTYCELCITVLNVGSVTKKNCRSCGVECVPLQVHLVRPGPQKGFFASLPGAFIYPMRGAGIFILLVGMIIFTGIRLGTVMMSTGSVRGIGLGGTMQLILGGYLFTFLQNIIHSTAAGDDEVPDLPGINFLEDILLPFFRLLGLVLVCFAPAIAFVILAVATASPSLAIGVLPAMLFGCAYFPMAFLAVAILDSVGAVNPLVILPSILKVPAEYIVTVVILAAVLIFTKIGDIVLAAAFPKGLMTQSIPELLAMFGLKFLWSLVSLYLLTVNTRILGLLYLCKKDKLAWLGR